MPSILNQDSIPNLNIMSTLSELYITMENLRKLNLPIDERLKQEAVKLEEDLIRTEILHEMYAPNTFNNYNTEI